MGSSPTEPINISMEGYLVLTKLRRFIAIYIRRPYVVITEQDLSDDLRKKVRAEYAKAALFKKDIPPEWFLNILGIKDYLILDHLRYEYFMLIEYWVDRRQYILMISSKSYKVVVPARGHSLSLGSRFNLIDLSTGVKFSLDFFNMAVDL